MKIPFGYCHCGCGEKTKIAQKTRESRGWVKGQPLQYLNHHAKPVNQFRLWKHRSGTPTYTSWASMMDRAINPKNDHAHCYSGRGIKVCERWQNYDNFVEDMGIRPAGKTLDRIDNNGNYEPANCRWATHKEQCSNTRKSRLLTLHGQTHTIKEWERIMGFSGATIWYRLKAGLTVEEAITIPLRAVKSWRKS